MHGGGADAWSSGGSGGGHGTDAPTRGDGLSSGGGDSDSTGGSGAPGRGDPDLGTAVGSSSGGEHSATSPGSDLAMPDAYSHVSVDSEGAPVGKLIAESGLTPSQLHDYQKNS